MTGRQIHVGSQRAANYLPQMHHHICLFTFAFEAELDRLQITLIRVFYHTPQNSKAMSAEGSKTVRMMLIQKYEQLQEKATILYKGKADGQVLDQLLMDTQST